MSSFHEQKILGKDLAPIRAAPMTPHVKVDQLFSEGLQRHLQGDIEAATSLYKKVLERKPDHSDALHHLGLAYLQTGAIADAVSRIEQSIQVNPLQPSALSNLGYCFNILGKYEQASKVCSNAVELNPSDDGAWTNLGNAQRGLGFSESAKNSYEKARRIQPNNPRYIYNLANSHYDLGDYEGASRLYRECLKFENRIPEAHSNLAACLLQLKDLKTGLKHANLAIELKPDYAEGWCNRGNALSDLERRDEALESYQKAIQLRPHYAEAWTNRGNVFFDTERYEEAVASYQKAIEFKSDYAQAWGSLGNALLILKRHVEALASFQRAIELNPRCVEFWGSRGNAFVELNRYEDALSCYQKAIDLRPDGAQAWRNLGNALRELKRHEEAGTAYQRAIAIEPDLEYVIGDLIHNQMIICDWTDLETRLTTLKVGIQTGKKVSTPFPLLGLLDSPALQRSAAEIFAQDKNVSVDRRSAVPQRPRREKIRIGYFSMDFREHPVAHLIGELIERHDRNKFEIYGFSFGAEPGGAMRQRLEAAFDKFFDVKGVSAMDIAQLSRQHEIDIAVDLAGHTQDSRPQIFAQRAAPIQVNYLGYPGTFGSECMDYLVGDATVITEENKPSFSEKTIILPHQFQVNPSERPIAGGNGEKRPNGLPEDSFVFCCFNNSWKITPEGLGRWARILNQAPSSVLWLHASSAATKNNLKRAFQERGVDSERIIFADRVSREDYLDQYKYADLFLDTLPYNAGTTASDALWMGLPVLTLAGKSFAGRMAASLLNSIGLPELIAQSPDQYESLAIELASNADRLTSIKARLASNRSTSPLFNTGLFAQHIEAAYQIAYDRHHAGLAPDHITVAP